MDVIYRLASSIISIINDIFVPLVFAVSFVFFILGVFNYFFLNADNAEKRKEGQKFVGYGLAGFFLMISVWGIVRLLTGTFGFDGETRPCLPTFSGSPNCADIEEPQRFDQLPNSNPQKQPDGTYIRVYE